jgi:hypothetical protein
MTDGCNSSDLLATVKRQLASVNSFSSLTAACDGAFPTKVAEALHHLAPKMSAACERLAEADRPHQVRPFSDVRLPLPHPLDFEWRYSNATVDELLRRLNFTAGPSGKLLLVCTPALALRAVDTKNPRRLIYASRMDDPVTVSLKEACRDRMEFIEVRDDLSHVRAAAALVDPPWYDDIALPLVTQAVRGLEEGGGLLVGIPDRLSGCSSAPILSSIATDARIFGIECARPLPGKLRYETPYFELNTLRRLGLRSVHPQWRTGRAVFGRKACNPIPKYRFPADGSWFEVSDRGWRVRLRRRTNDQFAGWGPIQFDIRESVSRRGTGPPAEECWTVGNRVAYALASSGHSVAASHRPPETSLLREIAEIELDEARQLVGYGERPKNVLEKYQSAICMGETPIYSAVALNRPYIWRLPWASSSHFRGRSGPESRRLAKRSRNSLIGPA